MIRLRDSDERVGEAEEEICGKLSIMGSNVYSGEHSTPVLEMYYMEATANVEKLSQDISRIFNVIRSWSMSGTWLLWRLAFCTAACSQTLDRPFETLFRKSMEKKSVPKEEKKETWYLVLRKVIRKVYWTNVRYHWGALPIQHWKRKCENKWTNTYKGDRQHGFKDRRSCIVNLLDLYDRVSNGVDNEMSRWIMCP